MSADSRSDERQSSLTRFAGVLLLSATIYVTRLWWGEKPRPTRDPVAELAAVVKADPPLGTLVEFTPARSSKPKASIFVFTPLCACDEARLKLLENRSSVGTPVQIVSPVGESAFLRVKNLRAFRSLFMFDPEYRLLRQFNAAFMPRAYVVNSADRLIWSSKEFRADWIELVDDAELAVSQLALQ